MIDSGEKKVVFRIADIGFSLAVDNLMEIREVDDVEVDTTSAGDQRGLLGHVVYRDDAIPFWDVRQLFGLPLTADDTVLVFVYGTDGAWAFSIETVVGVSLPSEFQTCDAHALLQKSDRRSFTSIDIWRNEPLVCFEPALLEQFMVQP